VTTEPTLAIERSQWLWAAVASIALTLAVLTPRLGAGPLGGTEAHRALTAHQMLQSHDWFDWLVPQLYGRLYLRKPPLHYWLAAGLEAIYGRGDEFIWRLPSVISTALLAGVLAIASAKWFGWRAGWVGGLSLPCMVALWAQGRTGEIDSLDTLLTVSALLIMIAIGFGSARRRWSLSVVAGVLLGGALMTKGPAGFIPLAGLVIWTAWVRGRSAYSARKGTWPAWGLSLAISLVIFLIYAFAVKWALAYRHVAPDMTGLDEILENVYPTSLTRLGEAIALPFIILVYALPFSGALAVATIHAPRDEEPFDALRTGRPSRRIIFAIVWTILISWLIGMVTGMRLPRYQFITLPLLGPLAGASMELVRRFNAADVRRMRLALAISVLAYAIGTVVLTAAFWGDAFQIDRIGLVAGVAVAVVVAAVSAAKLLGGGSWRWMWAIPALALLLSVPFSTYLAHDRYERSGFRASRQMRETLPVGTAVTVGGALGYQPELFFYSGLRAKAYTEKIPPPSQLPGNQWVVLDEEEYRQFKQLAPRRLSRVTEIRPDASERGSVPRNPCFVVWLLPAQ
jgi:4-amino-4-deoxy-L-arabinose transferase-like glycosyltransferase